MIPKIRCFPVGHDIDVLLDAWNLWAYAQYLGPKELSCEKLEVGEYISGMLLFARVKANFSISETALLGIPCSGAVNLSKKRTHLRPEFN